MGQSNFEKQFGISASDLSGYANRQNKRQRKGFNRSSVVGLGEAAVAAHKDPAIKKLKARSSIEKSLKATRNARKKLENKRSKREFNERMDKYTASTKSVGGFASGAASGAVANRAKLAKKRRQNRRYGQ